MPALPPGPRSVLLTGLRYLRDPYATLLGAHERYGSPHIWPTLMGTMVVTSNPETIETLFATDPDEFEALGADLLRPVMGESNVILLSGARHRAMRKLQMPPFHGARMRAYGDIILDAAREHLMAWKELPTVRAHATMQQISLDVILRAVVGFRSVQAREHFRDAALALIGALKPSFLFNPGLRRKVWGLSAWARFQKRQARAERLFDAELRERRASPDSGEDILSLLMASRYEDGTALSDRDLFVQMINLIAAGHETTASTLAFALHHVHQNPSVRKKLADEVRALPEPLIPEAVMRLPYLDAVCSETMRINPAAPLIGRVLRSPMKLDGYSLPPGTPVGIGILQVHFRKDLYPAPELFRPERFLERTFRPHEFLPFGGGARRCLGAAFATYEMKLVLASVLRDHDLQLVDAAPVKTAVRNTTVGPRSEILLRKLGTGYIPVSSTRTGAEQ